MEHDFEINEKSKNCSISLSSEFYGYGYIDNSLMFLTLHDNIFHIDKNKKKIKKIKKIRMSYISGIADLIRLVSQE